MRIDYNKLSNKIAKNIALTIINEMAAAKVYTMDEKRKHVEKAIKEILKEENSNYNVIYPYQIFNTIDKAEDIWESADDFFDELKELISYIIIPKYEDFYIEKEDKKTHTKYIESIVFHHWPCKEFEKLNRYVSRTLNQERLSVNDVMTQNVSGKRGVIFERYNIRSLAFEPELSTEILEWCKQTKKPTWHTEIEKKHTIDYGSRFDSHGRDNESEWQGIERNYIIIRFLTYGNKLKGEHTWYID